jgi:predicted metal-dependent hydrolase
MSDFTMEKAADVPVRQMAFEHWFADVQKYFAADGDIVMSHVLAVLSSVFPDGEDYFVRSVEAVQDQITDPHLARDVDGFVGQESMHGREHRAFNDRLAELGYPTPAIGRYVQRLTVTRERLQGPKVNLGFTAPRSSTWRPATYCSGTPWRRRSTKRWPSMSSERSAARSACGSSRCGSPI